MMRTPFDLVTPRPLDADARQTPDLCATSGILVLTFSKDTVYISPQASLFLQWLQPPRRPQAQDTRTLPPDVAHLCEDLEQRLLHCHSEQEWNQTPVERTVHMDAFRIHLRAFGLPTQHKLHGSQILILFERLDLLPSPPSRCFSADILLTERQQSIVTGVVRGLTNKELAQELGISIHTVKEYLRQIMMRLNTTSRAGIVSRMAGLNPTATSRPRPSRVKKSPEAIRYPQFA